MAKNTLLTVLKTIELEGSTFKYINKNLDFTPSEHIYQLVQDGLVYYDSRKFYVTTKGFDYVAKAEKQFWRG